MSKIDDYKFGEIVMKFREEGKSYEYIAKTLNDLYLPQDEERISVMAVQRWCKKYTEAQNSKALVKRTSKEMIESAVNNLPTREVDDENNKQLNEEIEAFMNIPVSQSPVQKSHEEREQKRHMKPSVMEEIKKKYDDREKRISELYDVYNRKYPDAEFVEDKNDFYEWLRNKDAPANEETINEFIEYVDLNAFFPIVVNASSKVI